MIVVTVVTMVIVVTDCGDAFSRDCSDKVVNVEILVTVVLAVTWQ